MCSYASDKASFTQAIVQTNPALLHQLFWIQRPTLYHLTFVAYLSKTCSVIRSAALTHEESSVPPYRTVSCAQVSEYSITSSSSWLLPGQGAPSSLVNILDLKPWEKGLAIGDLVNNLRRYKTEHCQGLHPTREPNPQILNAPTHMHATLTIIGIVYTYTNLFVCVCNNINGISQSYV